jgi:hypothetical protein
MARIMGQIIDSTPTTKKSVTAVNIYWMNWLLTVIIRSSFVCARLATHYQ